MILDQIRHTLKTIKYSLNSWLNNNKFKNNICCCECRKAITSNKGIFINYIFQFKCYFIWFYSKQNKKQPKKIKIKIKNAPPFLVNSNPLKTDYFNTEYKVQDMCIEECVNIKLWDWNCIVHTKIINQFLPLFIFILFYYFIALTRITNTMLQGYYHIIWCCKPWVDTHHTPGKTPS